ncbi:hypothetical protein HAX54_035527, partial [Datura stramonium]|nr:hypothetical protein [Datura stramonium]
MLRDAELSRAWICHLLTHHWNFMSSSAHAAWHDAAPRSMARHRMHARHGTPPMRVFTPLCYLHAFSSNSFHFLLTHLTSKLASSLEFCTPQNKLIMFVSRPNIVRINTCDKKSQEAPSRPMT